MTDLNSHSMLYAEVIYYIFLCKTLSSFVVRNREQKKGQISHWGKEAYLIFCICNLSILNNHLLITCVIVQNY